MLLVYGGGSIKRNGAYDDVTAALREAGNEVVELSGVTPNPRLDKVLEGVNLVREHGVNLILAVAGGSVIDCAKFISLGSGLGEDLWDGYVETGKPAPENLVPLGVVLTIAATGSEMGDVAVLTNWARNRKLGYTSFPLTPKFSVLDPTYLLTLPAEQITYGFVDMFCHTCEQYFSLPSDDNLSDEMAEAIQRHILRSWRACRRHPRSYEARSNAMWDSTFALNRVISRGKEEDWGTHGIEHALSAYFDISHGAGLAVVHPHWMKYVYTSRPEATARFARWAVAFGAWTRPANPSARWPRRASSATPTFCVWSVPRSLCPRSAFQPIRPRWTSSPTMPATSAAPTAASPATMRAPSSPRA